MAAARGAAALRRCGPGGGCPLLAPHPAAAQGRHRRLRARRGAAAAAAAAQAGGCMLSVSDLVSIASRVSGSAPPPAPPRPAPGAAAAAAQPRAVPLGSSGGYINEGNSYCSPPLPVIPEDEALAAIRSARKADAAGIKKVQDWLQGMHCTAEEREQLCSGVTHALVLSPERYTHVAPGIAAMFGFAPKPVPPAPEHQRECPDLLPGLRAQPRWDPVEAGCDCETARAAADAGLEGLRELHRCVFGEGAPRGTAPEDPMERMGFTPYINPTDASVTTSGRWDVLYINDLGTAHSKVLSHIPAPAAEKLRVAGHLCGLAVPRPVGHCVVSVLGPGTRITPHNGPNNKKLRLYLPIVGPPGTESCLQVAMKPYSTAPGQVLVFDDSFHHVAWNDSRELARVVLMWDFWHPDFTDEEAGLLSLMQRLHDATVYKKAGVETGPELHQVLQKQHFEEQALVQNALRQLTQVLQQRKA